ncbi:ribonuclease H-like domain-containing protein [Bacillus sp. JCM 19034]|uniref:ribonuclease H-like domain-containing protein n=1 Tax=Bacillus sp. JCM 19034 TaxID=1481928 RepID=UPI000781500D|nr:ribonuclease H-like domain-containing protein [Bacillus sp. JCM 19034]
MKKAKLNRLKGHMGLNNTKKVETSLHDQKQNTVIPYEQEWTNFRVYPYWFDGHYIFIRETFYPLDQQHGLYKFEQLQDSIALWESVQVDHPLSTKGIRADQLLFFDTETTGLSGGAGNTIFLLGFCQFKDNGILVKQYFLPGPEAEVALYNAFLNDIGNDKYLVTYNGKAFDWPQVKTRHTFVKEHVPKLPPFGHFDLLHAARRLWKNVLPTCQLKVVEEHELQFMREADTPSYLVPMLYFDFLNDPNPEYVQSVFLHHEWDVLSLLSLYIHLSQKIIKPSAFATSIETFEIARWFEFVGEADQAMNLYQSLLTETSDLKMKSLFAYASLLKKKKSYLEAVHYFKQCVKLQPDHELAIIELAKLLEHQFKDYENALFYCEQLYKRTNSKEIRKRIDRLQRKTGKRIFPGQAQEMW